MRLMYYEIDYWTALSAHHSVVFIVELMCLQLDIPLREVSDRCWLVNESGKLVDLDTDSKLDFHFDEMLDKVAEWKKDAAQDSNLLGNLIFIFPFSVWWLCWWKHVNTFEWVTTCSVSSLQLMSQNWCCVTVVCKWSGVQQSDCWAPMKHRRQTRQNSLQRCVECCSLHVA